MGDDIVEKTVARRVFDGLSANAYNQMVVSIVQFFGVPILLYFWGTRLFGTWLILFAIPSYLSMTDLGFSQSAANDMTASVARGDRAEALAVFQSLGALLCLITGGGLSFSLMIFALLPIGGMLHLPMVSSGDVNWVLWLLISEVLVKLAEGAVHAGFRANGRYAFYFSAYTTVMLLQQAALLGMVALGYGPLAAAGAFAGVRWVATPTMAVILFRSHPWLVAGFRNASWKELRRLFKPAMANLAVPLSQALSIQGMVLVVGATLGVVPVAIFSTLRTLSRFPLRLAWGINRALEPELAAAWGARKLGVFQKLFLHGLSASFWTALVLCIGLLVGGPWILAVWTSHKVEMDMSLYRWLLLAAMLGGMWNGSLTLLKAINLHLRSAIWYSLSSCVGLGFAAMLLWFTGDLANAGLALVVMDGLMVLYLLRSAALQIEMSAWQVLALSVNPVPLIGDVCRRARSSS